MSAYDRFSRRFLPLAIMSCLFFSACSFGPLGDDSDGDSTANASVTIENNTGELITLYMGDSKTKTPLAKTNEIAASATITDFSSPADVSMNMWFTYFEAETNTNWTTTLTWNDENATLRFFNLKHGGKYRLILNDDETYNFIDLNPVDPGAATTAAPVFSPASGTYATAQLVTLSCSTADSVMYYTLDSSTPTTSSLLYSDSTKIKVTGSVTVKAIAIANGMKPSAVVSATYTINASLTDPEVTLSWDAAVYQNYAPIKATATFSEVVTGFDSSDITVTNGSVTAFSSVDQEYRFEVTPAANGTVSVVIPSGVAQSTGGRNSVASQELSTEYYDANHGTIVALAAAAEDQWMYAVDADKQQILVVDTVKKGIVEKHALTNASPVDAVFSGGKLYVLHKDGPVVDVYDVNTWTRTGFWSASGFYGLDLDVVPGSNRVYVLMKPTSGGYDANLAIVNQANGVSVKNQVLPGSGLFDKAKMAIHGSTNNLFVTECGYSSSSMYRYSVSGDVVTLDKSVDAGGNGRMIALSPDGTRVVRPSGSGNGGGYTIYDYNSGNFSVVNGEWNIGTYPLYAIFSGDGTDLYATNGDFNDEKLHIMSASTYQTVSTYDFPNCCDSTLLAESAGGGTILGASYDNYNNSMHRLYFFPAP